MDDCRISVEVVDTNKIPKGMGFYDNYENILNFAIKTRGKFHSYIQSESLSIDLDKKGKLLKKEYLEILVCQIPKVIEKLEG